MTVEYFQEVQICLDYIIIMFSNHVAVEDCINNQPVIMLFILVFPVL